MKKLLRDNKHEFALYISEFNAKDKKLTIVDKSLVQRIISVLRLKVGNSFILFNRQMYAFVCIEAIDKRSVTVIFNKVEKNKQTKSKITVLLPILKREALESAVYSCTALGASSIQLVTTKKTRKWTGTKEFDRLERITLAAAEQSKNFVFPEIKNPIALEQAVKLYQEQIFFADPTGKPLVHILDDKKVMGKQNLCLLVGPEGDLTTDEKNLIKATTFCALTDTILRSEQALALFLGFFKIVLKDKIYFKNL